MHTIEIHPPNGGRIRIEIDGAEGEPEMTGASPSLSRAAELDAAFKRLCAAMQDPDGGPLSPDGAVALAIFRVSEAEGTIEAIRFELLTKLAEALDEPPAEEPDEARLFRLVKEEREARFAAESLWRTKGAALDRMTLHAAKVVEAATTPNGVLLATGHGALDQTLRGLIGAGEKNWWRDAIERADEIPF